MKRFLLAAGAVGALLLTASPAAAQRYGRGHTSFSVTIGNGYGYAPYSYGYSPYSYGYAPSGYGYAYPVDYYSSYYPNQGYYYSRGYRDSYRRHHRRHHQRYDRYDRDGW